MAGTPKGNNLDNKTNHPDAGTYNSSLTDYIWAEDYNDLAATANFMYDRLHDVVNSATETDVTQNTNIHTDNGLFVEADYTINNYYAMLMLHTNNNNQGRPKFGIWGKLTSVGSEMYLGTSSNYGLGINVTNFGFTKDTNTSYVKLDMNGNDIVNVGSLPPGNSAPYDWDTANNTLYSTMVFNPSNTNVSGYSVSADPEFRKMIWMSSSGSELFWYLYSHNGDAGEEYGFQFDFVCPQTDSYDLYINIYASNNTGDYWRFGVRLDSTEKYNAQPADGSSNINFSIGSLTAGTTYTIKFYQKNNISVTGSHTAYYHVRHILLRPS